ncbi:MAG: RNA polymerase sigma factor [Bacteroidales bacterium]|nr:RNA polymerase sigma factor [Bacteroidales bacterium]
MKYTDQELAEGCRKNDREFQKTLYDTYASELFAVCRRYVSCKEDAEDILQDAFIKLFANIHKYSGKGSLKAWLRVFFRNYTINTLRNKIYKEDITDNAFADETNAFDDVDVERFSAQNLRDAMDILSADERLVFNMIELDELTYQELETMLNRKQTTLRSLNCRAKQKMRNFLKDIEQNNNK